MKHLKVLPVSVLLLGLVLTMPGLFPTIAGVKLAYQGEQKIMTKTVIADRHTANSQSEQRGTQPEESQLSELVTVKTPLEDKNLKSFILHYTLSAEFPKQNQKFILLDVENTEISDNKGQVNSHTLMRMPLQNVTMEAVKVDDKIWVSNGSSNWVTGTKDQLNTLKTLKGSSDLFFGELFGKNVSELKQSESGWKYVGNAKINGVEAMHFFLKKGSVPFFSEDRFRLLYLSMLPDLKWRKVKADSAFGEVYIAKDGLLVKGSYTLTGTVITDKGEKKPVKIVYQYNVTHINDPNLKVKPPKGASQSVKAPFPLPPNAKLKMAAGDMQVFTVPATPVGKVMDFLTKNLPQAGFTISHKMGSDTEVWSFEVSGKGKTYTVEVGTDPDNNSDTDIAIGHNN